MENWIKATQNQDFKWKSQYIKKMWRNIFCGDRDKKGPLKHTIKANKKGKKKKDKFGYKNILEVSFPQKSLTRLKEIDHVVIFNRI